MSAANPEPAAKVRSLLTALVLVAVAAEARAAPEARFEYALGDGAETCPKVEVVLRGVARRLGRDPFRSDAPLRLIASIAKKKNRLVAHIELKTIDGESRGERTLDAPKNDCASLVDAMILAISIAIDPFHVPIAVIPTSTTTETLAERTADPKIRTALRATVTSSGAVVHAETSELRLSVGLGAAASLGSAPDLALGLALQISLARGWMMLAIEGRADLPASRSVSGGTVTSALVVASLMPCVVRESFRGCGVLTAGVAHGEGLEFADARSFSAPYVAGGARASVDLLDTEGWTAALYGEITTPLVRTTLSTSGVEVWSMARVAGAVGLTMLGSIL